VEDPRGRDAAIRILRAQAPFNVSCYLLGPSIKSRIVFCSNWNSMRSLGLRYQGSVGDSWSEHIKGDRVTINGFSTFYATM